MGEIKFVGALIMISLFAIALVGYAIGFANDNDAPINLNTDTAYNDFNTNAQGNLSSFRTESNASANAFGQTNIEGTDSTTVTGGEFKVGMGSLLLGMGSVVTLMKGKLFGNSPAFSIVLTALVAFLGYMFVRFVWKTWKGGNPE